MGLRLIAPAVYLIAQLHAQRPPVLGAASRHFGANAAFAAAATTSGLVTVVAPAVAPWQRIGLTLACCGVAIVVCANVIVVTGLRRTTAKATDANVSRRARVTIRAGRLVRCRDADIAFARLVSTHVAIVTIVVREAFAVIR